MVSGGLSSWATARRVKARHGVTNLTLLFADVRDEDEDLYRFNDDVARDIGVPITVVSDGRNPREVGKDRRHVGNTHVANCSHLLKQVPARKWLDENADVASTTLYVGIGWSEPHRIPGIVRHWAPWSVEMPMTESPYVDTRQLIEQARAAGFEPPRLYELGFAHNNCGGACVKAGQAQWAHLLTVFPDRYAAWEQHENEMRADLGKDVSILRDRRGGVTKPLPLTVLRRRIEASTPEPFDLDDWGGCGCFVDSERAPAVTS
jgi:hypothetical protein